MRTITVGQLRQNPTAALDAVEGGETFIVTRHRKEVGRLVPPMHERRVTATDYLEVLARTPLSTPWAAELSAARVDYDGDEDPWVQE